MNKENFFNLSFVSKWLLLLPVIVSAEGVDLTTSTTSTFYDVVMYIVDLLQILNPILSAIAFIVFFWGLSKFILNGSGNQAELKKGKDYMMWGILALFILISFGAIVSMVASELEIGDGTKIPLLPFK
jgi:hypothetical protein